MFHVGPTVRRATTWLRPRSKQRGNVMVIMAGSMTLLLGLGAWVVDMAFALQSRTHQQAAADAGALAGAHELLPEEYDEAAARDAAVDWTNRNSRMGNYAVTTSDVEIWDHPSGYKAITVEWTEPVDTLFARVFNLDAMPVRVASTAVVAPVPSLPKGFMPWGLPAYRESYTPAGSTGGGGSGRGGGGRGGGGGSTTTTGSSPSGGPDDFFALSDMASNYVQMRTGATLQLKVPGGSGNNGNYLALAIGGTGGNQYGDNIINGCDLSLDVPYEVPTEPGNKVGPTQNSLEERMANLGEEGREVVIPLIDREEWEENNGRSTVTIIGFVGARITHYENGYVTATYDPQIVPGRGQVGGPINGAGVFSPVLIKTP